MSESISLTEQEHQRLLDQYAEIASLAGGLAHEIRNPLSTMSLNLELLAEDLEETEDARSQRMIRKVNLIQQECQHLEEILDAFLQFVRVGELDLEVTDLNEVVSSFIHFYTPQAKEQNIEISPHLSINLPEVLLDRSLFRQVLMNLALNAQQAMSEGGLLELQTDFRDDFVILELIDTGSGIKESTSERIFEAFFSTKSDGNGLGLPTVRKIVEAHGGTIRCLSELGKGTQFIIRLPVAEPSQDA